MSKSPDQIERYADITGTAFPGAIKDFYMMLSEIEALVSRRYPDSKPLVPYDPEERTDISSTLVFSWVGQDGVSRNIELSVDDWQKENSGFQVYAHAWRDVRKDPAITRRGEPSGIRNWTSRQIASGPFSELYENRLERFRLMEEAYITACQWTRKDLTEMAVLSSYSP